MMISPETYVAELENESLPKLIKERDSLIREVRRIEKSLFSPDRETNKPAIDPSPEVVYQMDLEYLSALCELIKNRFSASMNAQYDEENIERFG